MLLNILDGNGNPQVIIAQGQGACADFSGVLTGGVAVIDANADRSGFLFQNNGTHTMRINEEGAGSAANAFVVAPGGFFPPYAGFQIPTTAIQISGTADEPFTYREW